jgi:hypothetical protein
MPEKSVAAMPNEFWAVYNRVARAWYDSEYGHVEPSERWYHPAMIALERLAAGMPMFSEVSA